MDEAPPLLIRIAEADKHLKIPLPSKRQIHIGRAKHLVVNDAFLGLPHPGMSKSHATIWTDGQNVYVVDQGSRIGTYVNGERLSPRREVSEPYALQHADSLRFGAQSSESALITIEIGTPTTTFEADSAPDSDSEDLSRAIAWAQRWDDTEPVLRWLTHADPRERLRMAKRFSDECGTACAKLDLSRRNISAWDVADVLMLQLCDIMQDLEPVGEADATSFPEDFGDVDEEWIRENFVEPLLKYSPPRVVIIIDSLNTAVHRSLVGPLISLVTLLEHTRQVPIRIFVMSDSDLSEQTRKATRLPAASLSMKENATDATSPQKESEWPLITKVYEAPVPNPDRVDGGVLVCVSPNSA